MSMLLKVPGNVSAYSAISIFLSWLIGSPRGYSREKLEENIGVMLSNSIYYEALDRLPAGRIFTVSTDGESEWAVLARVMAIISLIRGNNKS